MSNLGAKSLMGMMIKEYDKYTIKAGVNLNYILSNSYNSADPIFLFKEDLPMTNNRLLFIPIKFIFFLRLKTHKRRRVATK